MQSTEPNKPQSALIQRLRKLRADAESLSKHLETDLARFRKEDGSFVTYPFQMQEEVRKQPRVTTTCSALMALSVHKAVKTLYKKPGEPDKLRGLLFKNVWKSSGLNEGKSNTFTPILVLRASGFLLHSDILDLDLREEIHLLPNADGKEENEFFDDDFFVDFSLKLFVEYFSEDYKRLRIQDYPPAPAMAYWFLDGAVKATLSIESQRLAKYARWATKILRRQLSFVASNSEPMLDPPEMIMAACLCKKIDYCAREWGIDRIKELLPTEQEYHHSVNELIRFQTDGGIWNKYFPLFHYPEAGSNHVFTFEFLETFLAEFGRERDIFEKDNILSGIEKAVLWCEKNRREYRSRGLTFSGWHSGGNISTFQSGQPELWATAVVHMFLFELCQSLSFTIQNKLLDSYDATRFDVDRGPDRSYDIKWSNLLESPVSIPDSQDSTVTKVLEEHIVREYKKDNRKRRSVLLFGPPGTSKTTIVRAIAGELRWPYLELTPSHFIADGLEMIHKRTSIIFEDLLDLSNVVVLFDEMDAMMRSREGERQIDLVSQFLTTSLLPKLVQLHDHRKVLFFFATNHLSGIDPALRRPGRFDILLCVGPPTWDEKRAKMWAFLDWITEVSKEEMTAKIVPIQEALQTLVGNQKTINKLHSFTFREFRSFLEALCGYPESLDLSTVLTALQDDRKKKAFPKMVKEWHEKHIVLRQSAKKNKTLKEFEGDKNQSRIQ